MSTFVSYETLDQQGKPQATKYVNIDCVSQASFQTDSLTGQRVASIVVDGREFTVKEPAATVIERQVLSRLQKD